jgi:PTS system mannose-specific IIA component
MVVIGHGRLGEEMVHTLQEVLGAVEGVVAISTNISDSPEDIRARIRTAVAGVDQGQGVIILTDMLGDTATNQSVAVAREIGCEVVAGVNMPILIKLTTARDARDARALAKFIKRYGQEHIFWATEPAPVRSRQVN